MRTLLLALLVCCISCNRETIQELTTKTIQLPKSIRVNALLELPNGRIAAVGGQRLQSAWVYQSADVGNTWHGHYLSGSSSAYCIHVQHDSSAWIGGDSLKLWHSKNFTDWTFQWLADQVPQHESDRPAIRQIQSQGPQEVYFVGGDYYYKGVAYASADAGVHWNFKSSANALNQISIWNESISTWGYGNAEQYVNNQWQSMPAPEENLTRVITTTNGLEWASCQSGAILKRSTPHHAWQKSKELSDSNIIWLSGCHNSQYIIFGGAAGELLVSKNAGVDWIRYVLDRPESIFSMAIIGPKLFCGSDSGLVLQVDLP